MIGNSASLNAEFECPPAVHLISIVLRTKDRPWLVRRALRSVQSQTCVHREVFVVNSGEVLNLPELMRDDINLLNIPRESTMEEASNFALREATGVYFAVHDDDDAWDEGWLASQAGFLQRASETYPSRVVGAVSRTETIEEAPTQSGYKILSIDADRFSPSIVTTVDLRVENRFPPISALFKLDAAREIGLFRPNLVVLGDWDFNLRISALGNILVNQSTVGRYFLRPSRSGNEGNSLSTKMDLHRQLKTFIVNEQMTDRG